MWSIKNIIWGFWGSWWQKKDTYQDSQGKGIWQRYNELWAEAEDEAEQKIRFFIERVHLPENYGGMVGMPEELLAYRETEKGLFTPLIETSRQRRKILRYLHRLHANRGTIRNYIFLFGLLGLDVQVIELISSGRFDTGKFDTGRFDEYAAVTGEYDLLLSSSPVMTITPAIWKAINRIIEYNNPIYARVRRILYNGLPVVVTEGNGYVEPGYVEEGYVD